MGNNALTFLEVSLPTIQAKTKEAVGMFSLFQYLRYYQMFLGRFKSKSGEVDLTNRIEKLLFERGVCGLYKDPAYDYPLVLEVNLKKKDPNGNYITVDAKGENGYELKDKKVGEEIFLIWSDSSHIAPLLYIIGIATKILEKEDIIDQQDNMLRKPILIYGTGEKLDNAMNKLANLLSGVQFINLADKKSGKAGKDSTIFDQDGLEVLNLESGQAYKGDKLWESRDNYEALIRDYLGYPSVNSDKKERLINAEVDKTTAFAEVRYNDDLYNRQKGYELAKKGGINIEVEPILKWEKPTEGGRNNDSKDKVQSDNDNRQ